MPLLIRYLIVHSRTCFLILFMFSAGNANAQFNIDSLNTFLSVQPVQERIHFHLDKDVYLPGETIWFKAYILTDGSVAGVSKNLFTELWDKNGSRLMQFISPIIAGTSAGQFTLPDTLSAGNLIIKSFTKNLLQNKEAFVYSTSVRILAEENATSKATLETNLQLFPEGGTFVNNVANRIAFKATQSNGKPFNITGVIRDNKNKFIDSIKASHDGMGTFEFYPAENEAYHIAWIDNNGKARRTDFPTATTRGIAMQVRQSKNQLYYSIQNPVPENGFEELYIVATSGRHLLYSAKTNSGNIRNPFGTISTTKSATGVVQITVFDKYQRPVAERIAFINNNDYQATAEVDILQKSAAKRGKNIIDVRTSDNSQQTLSVSVSDANLVTARNRSIFTDMLLGPEVKGTVYQPDQYFGEQSQANAPFLDLVMLTNGWRRYRWDNAFTNPSSLITPVVTDEHISFTGMVTDYKNMIVPGASVSLIIRSKDSANRTSIATADERGFFKINDLIFSDTATLYFGVTKSKAVKQKVEITPSTNLLFPPLMFKQQMDSSILYEPFNSKMQSIQKTFENGMSINKADKRSKLLQEVKVTGKSKSASDIIDEKYAKLYKGTRGGRSYDIMNDPAAQNSANIMDYLLRWKLPSHIPHGRMAIYVDERKVLPMFMNNLRPKDIAYVKFVPDDFTEPFASGLYIYLKNDADLIAEDEKMYNTKMSRIKLGGYTAVKEFYHDDYSIPRNEQDKRVDVQTTVFWKPDIISEGSGKSIRFTFYNNDISDKLKIVVEGMNEQGKLVRVEKLIEKE